jgi:hypothetical protein
MAKVANQRVGFQVARTLPHIKALIKKESDIITKQLKLQSKELYKK